MNTLQRHASLTAIAAALLLAGCNSNPTKEQIGTVSGAVVGGIVGSTLTGGSGVGTVGGAAAGSYIGNRIGHELERK
ncbi:MAG TPA: glycine zipper domain-containing protein [Rhodocyclaceae bacterium]